ncbi:ABC-type transport system permease protein (probable substrate dipeptide/oligopeptide) (plasmid) [Halobacterium hubeiense]|uniref:ABC-type transport system permease protein (Probable substrate dipeptide/oligopeptide) n=1 Tax=Halobacterium hubeiense TaxID=1407499 RepID=A0A0U5AJZ8_9EURY|nr:ABC transporter permease [Halobacterium hubeiense]CQH64141.1 ABC-type transport system permease protein (probable substrate dipeptide/oligopeptide) [Halobacterium hubeiense]
MSFRRFLIKRTAIAAILTLVAVSIIFATLRFLPSDPFSGLVASGSLTPEQVAELRAMYGLDEPIWIQYLKYIQNLFTFQFGLSLTEQRPVWSILGPALRNTLVLLLPALVTTAVVSSLAGMYAGWNRGSWFEQTGIITTTFFRATPIFVTGILLLIIFSYGLGWFPAFGMRSPVANPQGVTETYLSMDFLKHYILPFTATVLFYSGDFLMLARNSVVERKGSEFLKLHRAKGLSEMEQLARAGRNSLLPLVTYFALRTGMLFQGVITLEVVFAWPGIGRALVDAILNQDYPTVQAAVFIMALAVIVMNLAADIAYAKLDPTVEAGDV